MCNAVSTISSTFYCRQHSLHGWSHEWELKQLTFAGGTRLWQYFETSTRNIYGFNTLDTLRIPTISDGCTAGSVFCTRGSVLLIILPVLAVFGPSVLVRLILPVRTVFRTPHTRVLQYTQRQQHPDYRTPQYCQHRQHQKKKYRTPYI